MLTLDATLQTRMDSNTRKPIIDVTARAAVSSIPFYGNFLTPETNNENNPNAINHSTGRICAVYIYGPDSTLTYDYSLKYVYSDAARSYYTTASFNLTDNEIIGVSLCELVNGNIGIVYLEDTGSSAYALKQKIITVTGTAVSAATIATFSSTSFMSGPSVIRDAETDNYLIVYTKISGSNYYAYKRTSSDFATWAAEAQLSIAGLTSTWKLFDPHLSQVTNHDIFLWFAVVESIGPNSEELSNIYYSLSADNGATWGTAAKVTAYTEYNEVATHPTFCEKEENSCYLAFNEIQKSLYMDYKTTGWPAKPAGINGYGSDPSEMHFDSVNRKLYCVNAYKNIGPKALQSIAKIDIDTWAVDDSWSTATTPAMHSIFDSTHHVWYNKDIGNGQYVPVSLLASIGTHYGPFIQLIDGENDTIKTFAFADYPAYGIAANVTGWTNAYSMILGGNYYAQTYDSTFVDLVNRRLWICSRLRLADTTIQIGYISLDDSGPIYTYVPVVFETIDGTYLNGANYFSFSVYPSDDLILITADNSTSYQGGVALYQLSTGDQVKLYNYDVDSSFPYYGMGYGYYSAGKIYGGITYQSLYGQENYRGLCEIDITTDEVTYYRPSFASVDNYYLRNIVKTNDGKLLIASDYGIAIFDTLDNAWVELSNNTVAGLTPGSINKFYFVGYDETTEIIFAGVGKEPTGWAGYAAFSRNGYFGQSQYSIATFSSSWSFSSPTPLLAGVTDSDATIICDPDDYGIIAFWVNRKLAEYSIKTEKDIGDFSLNKYLVKGKPISITRTIDNSPNSLSLTLTNGHLFDPFNSSSIWRNVLDKGNRLVVKFGESIGTNYWQNQGTFHITSRKLKYKKGDYPTIDIEAQDIRYIWKDFTIVATDYYDGQQPDDIVEDLLDDNTALTIAGDMDVPTFDNAVALDVQWTDTAILDAIQQICDRFGYYHRMTVDNKFSCRKIALDNAIDHTYVNSDQILFMSPDDSFSDFTNRVTVEGASRDYDEVLYDEEQVASLNGTVGWWGFKKDFKVWYSDDHTKQIRNPRLKVIESTTSIAFELAGSISEYLDDDDPNELYCHIRVEAPSLVPQLITLIAVKVASSYIPDLVEAVGFVENVGSTIRVGTAISNIASIGIMMILGACGNFQYEVWGQPIGEEKRSVEYSADDEECQGKIGYVVESRMEDSLCYSEADCAVVANHELDVVMAQRKRISIEKISHLQDEEGDTIRFIHPVSGQNMDVFVTDITRKYTIPESGASEEASCVDAIEGWVLS